MQVQQNTHSYAQNRTEEVTHLNTKAMSLVIIILSTSEVTIREVNSAVSDVRGPRALPPLSECKKHPCGHFKCLTYNFDNNRLTYACTKIQ
jgi:hypothetical protein